MDRADIANLVFADLESLLDKARAAYTERIPRLRALPPQVLDDSIEATRRTMRAFLRYYVAGTLDSESWRAVRDATLERAGEVFSREEILEFIAISRSIATDAVQHLAEHHPDLPQQELASVREAIDRYLAELALQEDQVRHLAPPERLEIALRELEDEDADIS